MDKYTRYARVYPSIVGMILPFVLTFITGSTFLPLLTNAFGRIISIISVFISSAIVYAALGYSLREMFRSISKWLFQFPLFKEDETEMPTTKLLLWKNHAIANEYHNNISRKVAEQFNIHLKSKDEEAADIVEAKLIIVNAVQNMRQITRDDAILLQYNYEFGFCRNYLGASVIAFAILLVLAILTYHLNLLPIWLSFSFCFLQLTFSLLAFISLKYRGKAYARQLLTAFMNA